VQFALDIERSDAVIGRDGAGRGVEFGVEEDRVGLGGYRGDEGKAGDVEE